VESQTTGQLVRRLLKRWGAFVGPAETETQVIDLLETSRQRGRPFRVMICDSNFCGESGGLRLASRVNPRTAVEAIPIVMLTTMGDRVRVAQESRVCGVTASALKPLRRCELLEAIQRSLLPTESEHRGEVLVGQVNRSGRIADILLVEDNAINQRLAVRFLEKAGHHVTLACSGQAAVQAVQTHDYECILMDVQMPEMDGLEATRLIRQHQQATGRRTPIIAMTAHAMPGDSERCLEAGMDDYIAKPVDFDRLLEMIDTWVTKAELATL
jgi:CheY-like chemotaxis protein